MMPVYEVTMTSNLDCAKEALALIGGEETLKKLGARGVESCEKGLRLLVPILGGLTEVKIVKATRCWDIKIKFDKLRTVPSLVKEVPSEKLKSMLHHLFDLR
jgi:hypothetical protein